MSDFHEKFMDLALTHSNMSFDPSTKVGAVVVVGHSVASLGFNHVPERIPHTTHELGMRDWKYPRTIHAEKHAIMKIGYQFKDRGDLRIYVTHFPCAECAAMIVESGIKEVITRRVPQDFAERWGASVKLAQGILDEAGVAVTFLEV